MSRESILFNLPDLSLHIHKVEASNKPLRGKHFHKEIELVYVNKGKLNCEIGNKKILLCENNGVFINSHTIHQLFSVEECCIFSYIQIDIADYINAQLPNAYKDFAKLLYSNNQKEYMQFGKESETAAIFTTIQSEAKNKKDCFEAYIKAYIFLLIAVMYRNNLLFDLNTLQKNKNILRFMPAIDYIENNFKSKIYLDDISKIMNINKFNLCKEFKKAFGYTVVEYINLKRLSYAQELLLKSDKSVLEIALESGFSSIQYFNKCFKTYKAYSPKAYQKLYRKNNKSKRITTYDN